MVPIHNPTYFPSFCQEDPSNIKILPGSAFYLLSFHSNCPWKSSNSLKLSSLVARWKFLTTATLPASLSLSLSLLHFVFSLHKFWLYAVTSRFSARTTLFPGTSQLSIFLPLHFSNPPPPCPLLTILNPDHFTTCIYVLITLYCKFLTMSSSSFHSSLLAPTAFILHFIVSSLTCVLLYSSRNTKEEQVGGL